MVHASSKNLYQLLDNLLQWSRSQSGALKFNPQKIELDETFNDSVQLFRETADAKNIQLVRSSTEENLAVYADRNMLDAILQNLISNAIKFTRPGGKVQIISERKGEFAWIKVTDNGVGMSAKIQERLFRIDKQNSTSGTLNETGTGLGLILVKEFVTRHGGKIGVESIEGKGSTFYFTIPLMKK
jgi:signal transduction histidine kinase